MKDILTKTEIHFWISIIGGVALTMTYFFNLKIEVVETKKDIAFIKSEVEGINRILERMEESTHVAPQIPSKPTEGDYADR